MAAHARAYGQRSSSASRRPTGPYTLTRTSKHRYHVQSLGAHPPAETLVAAERQQRVDHGGAAGPHGAVQEREAVGLRGLIDCADRARRAAARAGSLRQQECRERRQRLAQLRSSGLLLKTYAQAPSTMPAYGELWWPGCYWMQTKAGAFVDPNLTQPGSKLGKAHAVSLQWALIAAFQPTAVTLVALQHIV